MTTATKPPKRKRPNSQSKPQVPKATKPPRPGAKTPKPPVVRSVEAMADSIRSFFPGT